MNRRQILEKHSEKHGMLISMNGARRLLWTRRDAARKTSVHFYLLIKQLYLSNALAGTLKIRGTYVTSYSRRFQEKVVEAHRRKSVLLPPATSYPDPAKECRYTCIVFKLRHLAPGSPARLGAFRLGDEHTVMRVSKRFSLCRETETHLTHLVHVSLWRELRVLWCEDVLEILH
jgi:hypothetical protein